MPKMIAVNIGNADEPFEIDQCDLDPIIEAVTKTITKQAESAVKHALEEATIWISCNYPSEGPHPSVDEGPIGQLYSEYGIDAQFSLKQLLSSWAGDYISGGAGGTRRAIHKGFRETDDFLARLAALKREIERIESLVE